MYGISFGILFCTNPSHSGVIVRNEVTKARLQQKFKGLRGGLIMSGLVFLRQPFT
jgi:hypothetical protein